MLRPWAEADSKAFDVVRSFVRHIFCVVSSFLGIRITWLDELARISGQPYNCSSLFDRNGTKLEKNLLFRRTESPIEVHHRAVFHLLVVNIGRIRKRKNRFGLDRRMTAYSFVSLGQSEYKFGKDLFDLYHVDRMWEGVSISLACVNVVSLMLIEPESFIGLFLL